MKPVLIANIHKSDYHLFILVDCRDIFLTQLNPVAAALMSKMNIPTDERPQVKAECLRLLATLK
ncbi:hypothetical protein [Nostoc sp.]|uniref:hypothetical protein n=1 Tax=Nostoc sp. TaxID=1180 RepID=UPI002FF89C3D